MGAEKRERILDEAKGYVVADRNASYGEPKDNFQNIADLWNAQGVRMAVGTNFDSHRFVNATDVALMMVGLKLARLKHNPTHRDSWVDGVGYLACGGDIALPAEVVDETQIPDSLGHAVAARAKLKADVESDVEAIKRVADRITTQNGVKPRPIKDCPQA